MEKSKIIIIAAETLLFRQVSGEIAKFCTYEEAFRAINALNPAAKISSMRGKCCMHSPKRGVFAVKEAIANLIVPEYLNPDLSPRYGYKELQVKRALDDLLAAGMGGMFLSIADLYAGLEKRVKIGVESFRAMLTESNESHFSRVVFDTAKKLMTVGYFDMSQYEKIENKTRYVESMAALILASGRIPLEEKGIRRRRAEFVIKLGEQTGTSTKTARTKCRSPLVRAAMKAVVAER